MAGNFREGSLQRVSGFGFGFLVLVGHWGYIGIMEKTMATSIMGYIGYIWGVIGCSL